MLSTRLLISTKLIYREGDVKKIDNENYQKAFRKDNLGSRIGRLLNFSNLTLSLFP
jgi:hypothetical protein